MSDFQNELSSLVNAIMEDNAILSDQVKTLLIGKRITDASAEVWSSDGEWSINLTFEDESTIEVPGVTYATGPLADLIRAAGGQPEYQE